MPPPPAQNKVWLRQIDESICGRWHSLSVTMYASSLSEIGLIPRVWIWPWSNEAAEHIRRELAPIPVDVRAGRGAMTERN